MKNGDSLGPYRVLEQQGEGGPPPLDELRGEVWRGLAEMKEPRCR